MAALVARAESGAIDLVSYMATLGCRTFAERALIPAFVFFFFMLYPPAWVGDPRRAMAYGATFRGTGGMAFEALNNAGWIDAGKGLSWLC